MSTVFSRSTSVVHIGSVSVWYQDRRRFDFDWTPGGALSCDPTLSLTLSLSHKHTNTSLSNIQPVTYIMSIQISILMLFILEHIISEGFSKLYMSANSLMFGTSIPRRHTAAWPNFIRWSRYVTQFALCHHTALFRNWDVLLRINYILELQVLHTAMLDWHLRSVRGRRSILKGPQNVCDDILLLLCIQEV